MADTLPNVLRLPPDTLPVTVNAPSEPTEVMLVCAAVVSVPVKLVATTFVAPRLPTLALPVTLSIPLVIKLPALILPDATTVTVLTVDVILTLPPTKLPLAVIVVPVTSALEFTLPASTFPLNVAVVADISPLPLNIRLLPVALPMFGVIRVALALTMMLPVPSNAVVVSSTLALN